ncbi:MAG: tRNA (adenosine(37)-N6)-threonylcarbamoyltransferase complex dimerization subunit type 1 TsaB [Ruminococcaceae bacterium]|nr:tRNA (adenosine(37)-N6)-threonylcarbamoyltransferase complex dimerization subunit type 1 TsaB [Oscillospiraceae bacterium]
MNLLAVECSAVAASCAIFTQGKLTAEFFINNGLTHSQTLIPMIEGAFEMSGQALDSIDAIAISIGPGSFTGVRIGICTVKGLAASRKIPCIPVSTLEGMAYSHLNLKGILCPAMDARCSRVYNALFRCENGKITRLCPDRAITVEDLYKELSEFKEDIYLMGDGAELCYESFEKKLALLLPENVRFQHASGVGLAALEKNYEESIISPDKLLPFYLRGAKIN